MPEDWTRFDRGPDGDRLLPDAEAGLQMPLERAMLTQRAVRRVRPDAVDDAIVLRCIELALQAPTGSNGQNWEFVVVKDRAAKERLRAQYQRAWSIYGGVGQRFTAGRRVHGEDPSAPSSGRSSTSPRSLCWSWRACGEAELRSCPCRPSPNRRTTARSTRRCRTCCWRRERWASGRRSSRCPCGARRWCVASSGSRSRCSPAARCRWAGPRVAMARPPGSRSEMWSISTATVTDLGAAPRAERGSGRGSGGRASSCGPRRRHRRSERPARGGTSRTGPCRR